MKKIRRKFAYLRSLVTELARLTITGFSSTAANYGAAVDVLKKKYGKETAIQHAYVNDLLNLAPVFSDKDTTHLRKLYNSCRAHFRGLKALGVDENTFTAVVVPAVLQKLPEAFCLTIMRGANFLSWSMEKLLSMLLKALELRENHYYVVSSCGNMQNRKDSTTLQTKQEIENCAFCLGRYTPVNCTKVSDVSARKNILLSTLGVSNVCKRSTKPEIVSRLNYVTNVGSPTTFQFVISRINQQSVNLKLDQRPTLPLLAPVVFMLVREIV